MLEHFKAYHESYKCLWEKIQEEQHIKFEMFSEPVVTYVADPNSKTVSIATTMILVKKIQGVLCFCIMKVPFDSGGSVSMISKKVLPREVQVYHSGPSKLVSTLASNTQLTGKVGVQGICLPKFNKSLVINKHDFLIFNANCKYDMILGGNLKPYMGST